MFGETQVHDFFARHLEGWEIFRQPQVNGRMPDIAVLNPKSGLGIFEVKDWNLTSAHWRIYKDAVHQAQQYRNLFKRLFSARYNDSIDFPVTVGLIFTRASNADVQDYFSGFLDGSPYTTVSGRECLECGDIERIFPLSGQRQPLELTEDAANDLRSWLIEPHHSWEFRQPLDDDPAQRQFVRNPGQIKLRRMRGSAGAGKSVTLVRRAAKVAAEGKDVLFVCYNNSLIKYLKDVCDRTAEAHSQQIEWRSFHGYCGHLSRQLGVEAEYQRLADSNQWDDEIPTLILRALEAAPRPIRKFHAIFVDEGQDFNLSWWNVLRSTLRDDGEMMIAFDTAQQIYPRTDWNAETLPGAGFTGRWIELNASRRLPNRMLRILRSFAQDYHPKALDSLPVEKSEHDEPCDVRWVQVRPQDRLETCVKELVRIIQRDSVPVSRAMTDLTLLCDLKEDCLKAEALLAEHGIAVTNAVAGDDAKERKFKQDFTMRAPRVKVCNFHSYKGWQSRLIVLSVAKFSDADRSAALLYTMMTRLKKHPQGSSLTIVSAAPRLKSFGAKFEDFEDRT
jgi:hypothetical protein